MMRSEDLQVTRSTIGGTTGGTSCRGTLGGSNCLTGGPSGSSGC